MIFFKEKKKLIQQTLKTKIYHSYAFQPYILRVVSNLILHYKKFQIKLYLL